MSITATPTAWTDGDPQPDGVRHVLDAQGRNWTYDDEDGRWSRAEADGTETIPWDDLTFGYGPISRTDLDLDAIERRANAATEGPWWAWDRGVGWCIAIGQPDQDGMPARLLPDAMRTDIGVAADAAFIAAARTDMPALVQQVRDLEAQRQTAIAILGRHIECDCGDYNELLEALGGSDTR